MKNYKQELVDFINTNYGDNAQWILNDSEIIDELEYINERIERCAKQFGEDTIESNIWDVIRTIKRFHEDKLSPATVKVGDGATINLYSDRHACTIIKVTKCSITVQYDKATLDPNFKPQWVQGGFAGHCLNQDEQTYTYERNPEGRIETYRWSKKYNRYLGGGDQSISVSKGRHEFYDYNF